MTLSPLSRCMIARWPTEPFGHTGARRCFGAALAPRTPKHAARQPVGDLGQSLADAASDCNEAVLPCACDVAFAAARRTAAETALLKLLPAIRKSDASEETLAFMVCNALLACSDSNYEACLEWLARLRPIAHRCGGSLAQCDILHLTYTEAAFRGNKTSLARALVAERLAKKPASRLNRMLLQRLTMKLPG